MSARSLTLILMTAILFQACSKKNPGSPNSTGKGSEILVVCEKPVWDRIARETLQKVFSKEMEGLPESEPEFTLVNVPYANFTKFLQSHRNVFILEMDPGAIKTELQSKTNVWSRPQKVITLKVSSDSAFVQLIREKGEAIKEIFNMNERARFSAQNALSRNLKAEDAIEKLFNIKMIVSSDFYVAKKLNNFMWLRKETNVMGMGILIFTTPYTDVQQFTQDKILSELKAVTRTYIPGPVDSSFMTISESVIKPVSKPVNMNGNYAVETRGLWETHGDYMGGPFINYSVADTAARRIIYLYGYVYYPNQDKRNFIRQLESVIWSAEILRPKAAAIKKDN